MDDKTFLTGLTACIAVFGVTYWHQRKYCDDPIRPEIPLLVLLVSIILMAYSITMASFNPSTVNILISILAGLIVLGAGYMHFVHKPNGVLFKA